MAASTDYVMVVGLNDRVEVTGTLAGDVHYLATHVATRRAPRYSRPVLAPDPLLLIQCNYIGTPILHKDLIPLFPGVSAEPWHRLLVRALLQNKDISLVSGSHTIVEPWPRPELSGAYAHHRFSMDPEAVMEAVPGVLVQEINHHLSYSLRDPRAETTTVYCKDCSPGFIAGLSGPNIWVQELTSFDYARIQSTETSHVAWFEGIDEDLGGEILNQLRIGLEFPGGGVVSPRFIDELTIPAFSHPAYSLFQYITTGFNPAGWLARTRELDHTPPDQGCVNNQAILRKIS